MDNCTQLKTYGEEYIFRKFFGNILFKWSTTEPIIDSFYLFIYLYRYQQLKVESTRPLLSRVYLDTPNSSKVTDS